MTIKTASYTSPIKLLYSLTGYRPLGPQVDSLCLLKFFPHFYYNYKNNCNLRVQVLVPGTIPHINYFTFANMHEGTML